MYKADIVEAGLQILNARGPFNYEGNIGMFAIFIDQFRFASAAEQQLLRGHIERGNCERLAGFGWRMANQAIRTGNVEDIRRGLAAVVLAGTHNDFRDATVSFCLLYHSARKLGVEPDHLFKRASRLGTPKASEFTLKYLAEGEKSIEAMSFKEGIDDDGSFKYVIYR